MNCHLNVCEVGGFLVDVGVGFIEHVTCEWINRNLKYVVQQTRLEPEEVLSTIKKACESHASVNAEAKKCKPMSHKLPLSRSYIEEMWGYGSYQLASGQSVVILSTNKKYIYKHPVSGQELDTLLSILLPAVPKMEHIAFPLGLFVFPHVQMSFVNFFKFNIYSPPLSREHAKRKIVHFTSEVVQAIQELHTLEIAHLDIWLENICFNERGGAVLTDFDRSQRASELFLSLDRYCTYINNVFRSKKLDV